MSENKRSLDSSSVDTAANSAKTSRGNSEDNEDSEGATLNMCMSWSQQLLSQHIKFSWT